MKVRCLGGLKQKQGEIKCKKKNFIPTAQYVTTLKINNPQKLFYYLLPFKFGQFLKTFTNIKKKKV